MNFESYFSIFNFFITFFYFLFFLIFIGRITTKNIKTNFCHENNHNLTFLTAYFNHKQVETTGPLRKFLTALSYSVPMANLIIGVSSDTDISNFYNNYTLNIKFWKLNDLLPPKVVENLSNGKIHWKFYYAGMRYLFYKRYLQAHPTIKYVMTTDYDNLIFRNPFELFIEEPQYVHVMQDFYPFKKTDDPNTLWFNAYNNLAKDIKVKCHLKPFVNISDFPSQIPLNSGTLIGKYNNILTICTLMSQSYSCTGIFYNGGEQGLFNYLYYSGAFSDLGIKFKLYSVSSSLSALPNHIPLREFPKIVPKIYTLHHYFCLNRHYHKFLDSRIVEILNLNP